MNLAQKLPPILLIVLCVLAACDPSPSPAPTPSPTATLVAFDTPTTVAPTQTSVPTVTDTAQPPPVPSATNTQVVSSEEAPPSVVVTGTTTPAASVTDTANPATASLAKPTLQVLASGFGSPDDLALDSSGNILFGDFANNALNIIRPGSAPAVLASGFSEPEGIVVTKDGGIIVAEQGTNRIIEVNPHTGAKKMLRQLVNNTGKDGVDGLGLDPITDDILIPDSPNGSLLRMSRDGAKLNTIATGFVRPTGAAVESNGSILVADEFGNAVYRLRSGKRTRIASIYQPDDVVVGVDGSIFVNSLGGNIYRINPNTLGQTILTTGLKLPHGLGVDATGNVYVAEAGRNRILKLVVAQR
jgi:sugar lactone lactonase YvrE